MTAVSLGRAVRHACLSLFILITWSSLSRAANPDVSAFASRAAALSAGGPLAVVELGRSLLGTPYLKGALRGERDPATGLVLSLDKVDCMVLLEWLLAGESLAGRPGAGSADSLAQALLRVRFRGGRARWEQRNHFFSDWLAAGPRLRDAGASFSGARRRTLNLNCRERGQRWVRGVPCHEATVWQVPGAPATLDSLRTGDLVGFWAAKPGLDVTHVGVIVREEGRVLLLNASSRAMKVRLEPLDEHPAWKKGLLVFRLPTP